MNSRRQFTVFIAAQLALAAVLFWTGSAIWVQIDPDSELGGLTVESSKTGAQIVPLIPVTAVVAVIAVLGVIATGMWGRRIIAVATLVIAAGTIIAVVNIDRDGILGWVILVMVLSLGLVVTSASAVIAGQFWPLLGKKYQRDHSGSIGNDPWKALDQGIDPTLDAYPTPDTDPPSERA